ncbi:MAG: galactose oxidase, partial [Verrucomicrobiae bacterium]|nr:galactose oxidase [Verrucomicrobiae bacterium]
MIRILSAILTLSTLHASGTALSWKELPPLPDAHGFAGAFAGSVEGSLVVAGGANFPDKAPWEGGTKVWH